MELEPSFHPDGLVVIDNGEARRNSELAGKPYSADGTFQRPYDTMAQWYGARDSAIEALRTNHGFDHPEQWAGYALRKNFRCVSATSRPKCPDCSGAPRETLGQYVYYSTLLRLKTCGNCGLIWADALIDPAVINGHFERTYKDEHYFEERRAPIFQHLAKLISRSAPQGGSVLDIGGGMGHLLHAVRSIRMDLRLVVQDVSEQSIEFCKDRFGLETICGPMSKLDPLRRHDVVVLSDSLYYEDDLKQFWELLPKIVKPGGTLIIRVPNKLLWIRAARWFAKIVDKPERVRMRDYIKHFNPEHKYVFSRSYLENRLELIGFSNQFIPSPALGSTSLIKRIAESVFYRAAAWISRMFDAVISPSMIVVAKL